MESYLQRFLTIGRGDRPIFKELDLSVLIIDTLQLVSPLCRHHGIQIVWQPPGAPVRMQGDAETLRQMLLNLQMNAIEAVQPLAAAERKGKLIAGAFNVAAAGRLFGLAPVNPLGAR